jgi:hypothetical protein
MPRGLSAFAGATLCADCWSQPKGAFKFYEAMEAGTKAKVGSGTTRRAIHQSNGGSGNLASSYLPPPIITTARDV